MDERTVLPMGNNSKKSLDEPYTFYIPNNFSTKETIAGGMLKVRNIVEAGVVILAIGYPLLQIPMNGTLKVILILATCLPLAGLCLFGLNNGPASEFILDFIKYKRGTREYGFEIKENEDSVLQNKGKKLRKGENSNEKQ